LALERLRNALVSRRFYRFAAPSASRAQPSDADLRIDL
jgi:hypothetical protein